MTIIGKRLRHALGTLRAVRWITDRPAVGRVIAATVHGRLVRPSAAYTARELRHGARTAAYRLRDSGLTVHIRHNTTDASILDEIFLQRIYEPPAAISVRLQTPDRPLRIADLGANVGLFGAFAFERWPVTRLTAFEPHPENAALLRRTIAANGLGDRWRLIEACASTSDGELPFVVENFSDSRVAGEIENSEDGRAAAERVAAVDVFPLLGNVDLIKMDIEGGEWTLLADPRLANLPAIAVVLEYHPHLAPGPDAREEAKQALKKAGYAVEATHHDPRGNGMLWGWRAPDGAEPSSPPS